MTHLRLQRKRLAMLIFAGVLSASVVAHAAQAAADAPATGPGYGSTPDIQRHHRMGELMDQMQTQMAAMSKKMADPGLTAEERKTMSEDMKRMAAMMRRMSGLVDRPSMKDAEARKQMDEMQKAMAAMQKRHQQAAPTAAK